MNRTMDRKIIFALAALTLAFAGLAQAKLDRIEEAYELDLTQVILPAHSADRVTLKQCEDCFTVQLQADDGTSYHRNGPRKLDSAVSEILHGIQAAKLRLA